MRHLNTDGPVITIQIIQRYVKKETVLQVNTRKYYTDVVGVEVFSSLIIAAASHENQGGIGDREYFSISCHKLRNQM